MTSDFVSKQVECLSCQAVETFRSGDFFSTQLLLTTALRCVFEQQSKDEVVSSLPSYNLRIDQAAVSRKSRQSYNSCKACKLCYYVQSLIDPASEEYNEIYTKMILLTSLNRNVNEMKSILLFNLALIYHLNGIALKQTSLFESNASLHEALQLYKQSLEFIHYQVSADEEDQASSEVTTTNIILASAFHNMANIFTSFLAINEARTMRSLLATTLSCIGRSDGSDQCCCCHMTDEDFHFFQINLIFSKLNDFHIAPAA